MVVIKRFAKMDLKKSVRIFDLIIISLIIAASIYLILDYKEVMANASEDIEHYGLWALFIFTFLFEFLPQFISPDYSLLLAIGIGVNAYSVVIVTIVASAVGSWLAFLIGYYYGFGVIAQFFSEYQLSRILRVWGKHGKWFVLAAGTVPLPIPYIPVIFGALRMSKKDFILWGIIPRLIGFIITGIVGYYWMSWIMGLV
jgi:membrane protein YqaA with SNARE-associated domain